MQSEAVTVLVVDDDACVARAIQRLGAADNIRVHWVEKAGSTVPAAVELCPNAIVLDWNLPGSSGRYILDALRNNKLTARIPILVLTGHGSLDLLADCLENGADDYVSKPFRWPELRARLRLLARKAPPGKYIDDVLQIDFDRKSIHILGENVTLSQQEWSVLRMLVAARPRPIERNVLSAEASMESPQGPANHKALTRLRKRLAVSGRSYIETVHGCGYAFVAPQSDRTCNSPLQNN